jgi:hypothetical protein
MFPIWQAITCSLVSLSTGRTRKQKGPRELILLPSFTLCLYLAFLLHLLRRSPLPRFAPTYSLAPVFGAGELARLLNSTCYL